MIKNMEKKIVIYVVGPEGVGKSTMVKTFTKGKICRKRVEGLKCWATNMKKKESDLQEISIYEYRGVKGNITLGPSLRFYDVHVLVVMCRQPSLSEACKNFRFNFWKKKNTQTYLVQNIYCSDIRNTRDLETVGTQFGFAKVYQLPVNVKEEVLRFFDIVITDLQSVHPDFHKDESDVIPTMEDSRYSTVSMKYNIDHTSSTLVETYRMGSKPRGICIIIDNEDFGNLMAKRFGSDQDREKLKKLFENLYFDVVVLNNQTRSNILGFLKRESTKDHRAYSCFACCILSHGAQDIVYGTDGNPVYISELTVFFEGDQCTGLVGKPKIFIIQACQGSKQRTGVEIAHVTDSDFRSDANVCPTMPVEADFLITFATTPGSLAYRDENNGTHYISTFVDVLRHNLDKSLTDVLTAVNCSMAKQDPTFRGQRVKQMGYFKSTLCKKIIFGQK